jgi:hypothetical protein
MRFVLYVGISVALLAVDRPIWADEPEVPMAPEAAKAAELVEFMRGKRFEPTGHHVEERWRNAVGEPLAQWCQRFLDDFRAQRNISHIEPVARAQRYGDPAFRPWQDRCPTLAMNGISEGKIYRDDRSTWGINEVDPQAETLWWGGMLPNYQFRVGAFKVFEVDVDNDAANGVETIFYSERFYWYWPVMAQREARPGLPPTGRNWNDLLPPETVPMNLLRNGETYAVLDLQQCRINNGHNIFGGAHGAAPSSERGLSGIIRYDGRNFLYDFNVGQAAMTQTEIDLGEAPRFGYSVSLSAVARIRERWDTAELCNFATALEP